jgi:transposase-like protein
MTKKRRNWDSRTKWLIVLEGLKGRSVADICTDHAITQSLYYKWRDQFLSEGYKVFETAKADQVQKRLSRENTHLKHLVGELTLELKKSEALL